MNNFRFAEKHPFSFSFLLLLMLVIVQAVGVGIAQQTGLPLNKLTVYTEFVLAFLLVIIVTRLGWWKEIGFRKPATLASLLLYLPALALPIGNLTFGFSAIQPFTLLNAALVAAFSGFVEEVTFRGLMLRAFLPRGEWKAVLITTAFFGFVHAINVVAGYEPLYVVIQIFYALAIGFGFGAMAIKGRMIWPLIIAHGLGNFFGLINNGQIGTHLFIVSLVYIILFTGYGLFLMLRKNDESTKTMLNVNGENTGES
jgi:membrane protease YdiL (CAAX protease family)